MRENSRVEQAQMININNEVKKYEIEGWNLIKIQNNNENNVVEFAVDCWEHWKLHFGSKVFNVERDDFVLEVVFKKNFWVVLKESSSAP